MKKDFRGPAAKGFDWQHIFDNHSDHGLVALQSSKKTIFRDLSEAQIEARVKAAWQFRSHVRSQFDPLGVERILYRAAADAVSGEVIEFWYNAVTRIVETAYPVKAQL